ncbi:hypothetical protein V5O48_017272, partial [Marasmius crinis-equi]
RTLDLMSRTCLSTTGMARRSFHCSVPVATMKPSWRNPRPLWKIQRSRALTRCTPVGAMRRMLRFS